MVKNLYNEGATTLAFIRRLILWNVHFCSILNKTNVKEVKIQYVPKFY